MAAAMLLAGRVADKAGRQPVATTPYYCQHYNPQHGLKLVMRPIPFDDAQLQKVAVPFTLMWHKRNGHNPKIIWLKPMIKQLYGDAFQSGFLSA